MEEASFVPPSPDRVPELLSDWEKYWHSDSPDPMTQLALIHAQFEIIHPFVDGNGRLGRMIIPLFLLEKGRLRRPSFYLSSYFEAHRDAYIGHLRELQTPGGWNRWCRFFLEGVIAQANADTSKVTALQALYARLKDRVLELTHSQYAVPLLDYMFVHPIFQSSTISQLENMPTVPMVWNMLNKLKEDGILYTVRKGAGRRPYVFALAEFVNLTEGRTVFEFP
jgi:Fic family protein